MVIVEQLLLRRLPYDTECSFPVSIYRFSSKRNILMTTGKAMDIAEYVASFLIAGEHRNKRRFSPSKFYGRRCNPRPFRLLFPSETDL